MNKTYLFKSYHEGTGKTSKKPFRILELHDQQSLENTQYFLQESQELPALISLKFKDSVDVVHGIAVFNGKPNMTIESIVKAIAK